VFREELTTPAEESTEFFKNDKARNQSSEQPLSGGNQETGKGSKDYAIKEGYVKRCSPPDEVGKRKRIVTKKTKSKIDISRTLENTKETESQQSNRKQGNRETVKNQTFPELGKIGGKEQKNVTRYRGV